VREVPAPQLLNDTDVLLDVDVVGVCGSDLHYYRTGHIGDQVVRFPWRVGHEFAATVRQVGSAVQGLKQGDRVAVDPLIVCRRCDQCVAGRPHTCRNQAFMGVPGQLEGCLAEQVVMPAECCYPIPDQMTPQQAVLVEPLSICLHAQRLSQVRRDAKVAVLGAGPMGLGVLAAVRAAVRCKTYVTDLFDERLAAARALGADWTANVLTGQVAGEILAAEPLGMDVVFECAGQQETLDQACEILAPGGTLVIVGIPETHRVSFSVDAIRRKELRIQNVRRQNGRVQDAIDMLVGGEVDLDLLVTHVFPLDRVAEAFELVSEYRDGVIKAMINVRT